MERAWNYFAAWDLTFENCCTEGLVIAVFRKVNCPSKITKATRNFWKELPSRRLCHLSLRPTHGDCLSRSWIPFAGREVGKILRFRTKDRMHALIDRITSVLRGKSPGTEALFRMSERFFAGQQPLIVDDPEAYIEISSDQHSDRPPTEIGETESQYNDPCDRQSAPCTQQPILQFQFPTHVRGVFRTRPPFVFFGRRRLALLLICFHRIWV